MEYVIHNKNKVIREIQFHNGYNNLDDKFKKLIDDLYEGKKINKKSDLIDNSKKLNQIIDYLIDFKPENIRFIYHKLNEFNLGSYELIKILLQDKQIMYYAIDCSRRFGIVYLDVDAKNIATPIVLKLAFGFNGCCTRYQPAPVNKDGKKVGYPDKVIYKFNVETYEYDRIPNKEYRKNRYTDFINLNSLDLSDEAISARPKLKILLAHLHSV